MKIVLPYLLIASYVAIAVLFFIYHETLYKGIERSGSPLPPEVILVIFFWTVILISPFLALGFWVERHEAARRQRDAGRRELDDLVEKLETKEKRLAQR